MPARNRPTDPRLLAKVGTLYYRQALTQQQIADSLHISRPKVSRMLDEARRRGIVQITIVPPPGAAAELEAELEGRYGLKEAIVIEAASATDLRGRLGEAAAKYLRRTLSPDAVVGLTWGTTLHAMVEAVRPRQEAGTHVVQTLGGVGSPQAEAHAADLARRLAQTLGADLDLLPVPGIVGSAEAQRLLHQDPNVQATLRVLDRLTAVFVGIGALSTNQIFEAAPAGAGGLLPADLLGELKAKGVVGDVALRFFDAQGEFVPNTLDERLIGISPDQLRRVPFVVGVAGGAAKAEAIRAALTGRIVNVLITDSDTARALLAER